jgi:hypothetical protein
MIEADPETIARDQTPELEAKRAARMKAYNKSFLPKLLATYMPWYNPSRVPLPGGYETARTTYSNLALGVR